MMEEGAALVGQKWGGAEVGGGSRVAHTGPPVCGYVWPHGFQMRKKHVEAVRLPHNTAYNRLHGPHHILHVFCAAVWW